jgi:exopolysaccharide biosynthesis polyprenyl glycosylphosphotransferase
MIRLFRVSIPSSSVALVLSETILILSCYLLAAYATLDVSSDIFLWQDGGWWRVALVVLLIFLGLYFHDLYDTYRIPSRTVLVQQFCFVVGIAFLLQASLSYGRWDIIVPRRIMLYGSVLVLALAPLWRIVFTDAVRKSKGAEKLLFLGSSAAVHEIFQSLRDRPELGMTPIGFLGTEDDLETLDGVPCLGAIDRLSATVEKLQPDRIIVGMKERRDALPIQQLLDLRFAGVKIEDSAATYETVFHRVSVRDLRPSQLVFSVELGPQPAMVATQAVYSWMLGVAGFIIGLPLMVVVAAAVKLFSRGPVFYRQTRVGKEGAPFTLYKFRSMYPDAEARSGAVWASKDDPRVTAVGRWLRKLRLDEMPQLFNVIRGEMSLVGPRPERPEFVQMLQEKIPYYRQRLCVKPGVTGWAQINHKYGDTVEDVTIKLEYDLYYIKNLAPSLDAYILFHTAKTVLLGRGAQ